jgi:hypothetical protein
MNTQLLSIKIRPPAPFLFYRPGRSTPRRRGAGIPSRSNARFATLDRENKSQIRPVRAFSMQTMSGPWSIAT